MIEWGRVPWSLWAYSLLLVGGMIRAQFALHGQPLTRVLLAVLILAWAYYLLRGVRWLWILTLVVNVIGLVFDLSSGRFGWVFVTGVASFLCLVAPATRRYFAGPPRPAAG